MPAKLEKFSIAEGCGQKGFGQQGFTMVELLVSMSMVLILSAMAINVGQDIRARSADAQALSAQHNLILALSDTFSKLTEGMPNSMCNGADVAFFKKSGVDTLQILNDGAYTTAQAASGAQRPETVYKANTDVGYSAEINSSVTSSATIQVSTWSCAGHAMYVKAIQVTCGTGGNPFPEYDFVLPLPADCPNYPPL